MIATLRTLLAAATPGRWAAFGYGDEWVVEGHQLNSFAVAARAPEANAALIAAMHEALPLLLAVAETAKEFSNTWEMRDSSYTPLAAALRALEGKA